MCTQYDSIKIGGYDIVLGEGLSVDLFACPLCKKLMRDPIQTKHGEVACMTCYTEKIKSDNTCLIDNEVTLQNDYFLDKFRKRQILKLPCVCLYRKNGCGWNGTVDLAEEHQLECSFQPAKCPECCEYLENPERIEEHFRNCSKMVGRTTCLYEEFGCRVKVRNTEELIAHVKEEALVHSLLEGRHSQFVTARLLEMKNNVRDWKETSKSKTEKFTLDFNSLREKISAIVSSVKDQEKAIECLFREKENSPPIDTVTMTKELSVKISEMENKISELHLKQQLYENTSFDGTLLWKIDQFQFRTNQAAIGRTPAIHSAPCFTEERGYKFCARLYLNGDGMGKCTHVSIFFVLMEGSHDNLLTWPFRKRVYFKLINQEDESKNIEESFFPDPNSGSFQKPVRAMNRAAGCPMFITKDQLLLDGYIKDDAIFFQIGVT